MLSIFYTRREIATRIAILYTGNILATAFAGLIAIGIFKMDGVAGYKGKLYRLVKRAHHLLIARLALAVYPTGSCHLRRRRCRNLLPTR